MNVVICPLRHKGALADSTIKCAATWCRLADVRSSDINIYFTHAAKTFLPDFSMPVRSFRHSTNDKERQ